MAEERDPEGVENSDLEEALPAPKPFNYGFGTPPEEIKKELQARARITAPPPPYNYKADFDADLAKLGRNLPVSNLGFNSRSSEPIPGAANVRLLPGYVGPPTEEKVTAAAAEKEEAGGGAGPRTNNRSEAGIMSAHLRALANAGPSTPSSNMPSGGRRRNRKSKRNNRKSRSKKNRNRKSRRQRQRQ